MVTAWPDTAQIPLAETSSPLSRTHTHNGSSKCGSAVTHWTVALATPETVHPRLRIRQTLQGVPGTSQSRTLTLCWHQHTADLSRCRHLAEVSVTASPGNPRIAQSALGPKPRALVREITGFISFFCTPPPQRVATREKRKG